MTDLDPFAEPLAGYQWDGNPLFCSATHYYIALAVTQAPTMTGPTADLAALWVFRHSPDRVLELERRFRKDPDGVYSAIFEWIAAEELNPLTDKTQAGLAVVREILEDITNARDEIDAEGIDADGDTAPGKSHGEPDMPPASHPYSHTTTQ